MLLEKKWLHGDRNCAQRDLQKVDVLAYDEDSYIIRQNKCFTYEAPFIYLLFGDQKAFLFDSGTSSDPKYFPLLETIESILSQRKTKPTEIIVGHSHNHSDHYSGDGHFIGKELYQLVGLKLNAITDFYGIKAWPESSGQVDLGNRTLKVIPSPGHQEEAISIYDPKNQWLLSGDTVYPGLVYVKDWEAYRSTINRLLDFTSKHPVSAILGGHIELTTKGTLYPIGTTYQPNETSLPLFVEDLRSLQQNLNNLDQKGTIRTERVWVEPMGFFRRQLSNLIRFFSGF